MTDKIRFVRGDTGPQIQLTLTDDALHTPIDLTGAEVTLHFQEAQGLVPLFSRSVYVNPITATQGIAVVVWQEGDLDVPEGNYEAEIEVFWPGTGLRQTVFDKLRFKCREQIA